MGRRLKKPVVKTKRRPTSKFWKRNRSRLISGVLVIFAFSAIAYFFHRHKIQAQRSFIPIQAEIETEAA